MFHLDVHIQGDAQVRAGKPFSEFDIVVTMLGKQLDIETAQFLECLPLDSRNCAEEPVDCRRTLDIGVPDPEILILADESLVAMPCGVEADDGVVSSALERFNDSKKRLARDHHIGINKNQTIAFYVSSADIPPVICTPA